MIELSESDKNIIRYCVEDCYKLNLEKGQDTKAEILKSLHEKLIAIRDKEYEEGRASAPWVF